jgi:hypothetical protein
MALKSEEEAASPEQAGAQAPPDEGQEPRTASERYMASLWKEIIGLERVLLPHRFLEVGGNSLTLNIILIRIEAETGAAIDPQLFLDDDRSSVRELARELDALRGAT